MSSVKHISRQCHRIGERESLLRSLVADDSIFLLGHRPSTDRTHFVLHAQTFNKLHIGKPSCNYQYHLLVNHHHSDIRDLVAR
jgi:hypothetical protein